MIDRRLLAVLTLVATPNLEVQATIHLPKGPSVVAPTQASSQRSNQNAKNVRRATLRAFLDYRTLIQRFLISEPNWKSIEAKRDALKSISTLNADPAITQLFSLLEKRYGEEIRFNQEYDRESQEFDRRVNTTLNLGSLLGADQFEQMLALIAVSPALSEAIISFLDRWEIAFNNIDRKYDPQYNLLLTNLSTTYGFPFYESVVSGKRPKQPLNSSAIDAVSSATFYSRDLKQALLNRRAPDFVISYIEDDRYRRIKNSLGEYFGFVPGRKAIAAVIRRFALVYNAYQALNAYNVRRYLLTFISSIREELKSAQRRVDEFWPQREMIEANFAEGMSKAESIREWNELFYRLVDQRDALRLVERAAVYEVNLIETEYPLFIYINF